MPRAPRSDKGKLKAPDLGREYVLLVRANVRYDAALKRALRCLNPGLDEVALGELVEEWLREAELG